MDSVEISNIEVKKEMISANNVNKIANKAAARIKEEDTQLVQKWIDEIDLEKCIVNAAEAGFYKLDIDIKECPNYSIFKQIMNTAGYDVDYYMVGGSNAIISWYSSMESAKSKLENVFSTGRACPKEYSITVAKNAESGGFTF